MKVIDVKIFERALERERAARKQAEKILESKSTELYLLTQKLKESKNDIELLLEKRNSELTGLIQNILDPYLLVDLSGNILKYNKVAKELLGINNDVNSSKKINLINFIQEKDKGRMIEAFKQMIDLGYVKGVEVILLNPDSEPVSLQINAGLLYNASGVPTAAQGIARDITDLKKLELQKDLLLDDLVSKNEELKEYAHVVSHDLKSPLRGISSLLQWVRDDDENVFNDKAPKMFEMIFSSISRMENLIGGILRYSTSDAYNDDTDYLDMYEIITHTAEFIQVPSHISVLIPQDLPSIFISKRKIEQVVQNLMSNAVKFVPDEGGLIEWSFRDIGLFYEFSISDNGIGIEKKHFERIFQVFQALTKSKESTGIGLSIVKKVIKSMGGNIWLDSEVGKGTTFYFTIPKNANHGST